MCAEIDTRSSGSPHGAKLAGCAAIEYPGRQMGGGLTCDLCSILLVVVFELVHIDGGQAGLCGGRTWLPALARTARRRAASGLAGGSTDVSLPGPRRFHFGFRSDRGFRARSE